MDRVMEFFTNAGEVYYQDADGMHLLIETSPLVPILLDRIRELYPQAYDALCMCYAKSRQNISYFNFLVTRRFCKCNFGALDHTKEDVCGGVFNFECVPCPLRGECQYEGTICSPKMDTSLSKAEMRVMKLVCEGRSNDEIAGELYLSPNTIRRHISSAYIKTRTRNRAEFVKYANDNSIFQ